MLNAKKRFKVLERDGFRCQYCGKNGKDVSLEVDHIIPKSKGGTDEFDNLITCCRECNIGKGNEYVGEQLNIGKLKLAEHESKMVKWFFKEWNKLRNGEIDKRNLSFISSFIKYRYNYTDFRDGYLLKYNSDKITEKEFIEGGDMCEQVLREFDMFMEEDLEYILENIEGGENNYTVWRERATKNYNVRLNRLITYQMVMLRYPMPLIYKYSLCPNKVKEWENEREEF